MKLRIYILITLLIIFILYLESHASTVDFIDQIQNLNPKTLNAILEKGDIVITKRGEQNILYFVIAITKIEAPPENIWQVITDYNNYPKFVPNVDKAQIRKIEENSLEFYERIFFNFSAITIHGDIEYRVHFTRPYKIDAIGIGGNVKNAEHHWRLIPIDNGEKTIVLYSNYTDLKSFSKLMRWTFEQQPASEIGFLVSIPLLTIKAIKNKIIAPRETQFSLDYEKLLNDVQSVDISYLEEILGNGEIIVFERDKKIPNVGIAGSIFDGPPEDVFYAVTPEVRDLCISPNTENRLIRKEGNSAIVEWETKFKFSIITMTTTFVKKHIYNPPYKVDTTVVSGDIDKGYDGWRILPIDNGKGSIALFTTNVNYRSLGMLMKWVLNQQPDLELGLVASVTIVNIYAVRDYFNLVHGKNVTPIRKSSIF